MGTSLASKTIGGGDQAFKWYLHTSGGNIGGATRICNGNGDDTGLLVSGSEIGIHNGSATTIFNGLATTSRGIDFPDADGTVLLDTTTGRTVAKLGSDSSSTSTTFSEIGSFSFTPSASKTYSFKIILRVQSAAGTTAAKMRFLGPTVDFVTYRVTAPRASASGAGFWEGTFDALDEEINPLNFYDSNGGQGIVEISGIVKLVSGAPTSQFRLSLASEVLNSEVKVLEGSAMIFEEL